MPSPSKAMRRAAAIAEHDSQSLNKKNKSLLSMSKQQLHDFASTPEKGLPEHVAKKHGDGFSSLFKK